MSRIILRVELLCCTVILAALALPVRAHTGGTTGLATVIVSGQTVQYNLQLPMSSVPAQLADAMHLGQPGLAPDYAPLLKTVEEKIHVRADDTACEAAPGAVTPPTPEGGNAIIVLNFACAAAPKQLTVRDDLFDTLGVDYHTIANLVWSAGSQQFVFMPDARETRVTVSCPTPTTFVKRESGDASRSESVRAFASNAACGCGPEAGHALASKKSSAESNPGGGNK